MRKTKEENSMKKHLMAAGILLAAAGMTAAEPDYLFFNIVPCSIGQEEQQAQNMIEL